MPHQAPLQPGDPRRVGRYRLSGRITGIQADGPIFLGAAPDGAQVTISMLRADWAGDGAARDRFAAEAAVAKRVPPFCAARILDAGLEGDDAYLVSEYVPGRSLLEVISATGPLPEADLGPAAIGMATGLASVHTAGLVHGNFGPGYVVMTAAGPRVVEFGITPPYGNATPAADMLAWAQTVVFAATGKPAKSMADLDVLPGELRDLVEDCLSPEPQERPAARPVVLRLLRDQELRAGVLAEGSRRAMPDSGFAVRPSRRAIHPPVPQPADGLRPPTPRPAFGGSDPRPLSRHSRPHEALVASRQPATVRPERQVAHHERAAAGRRGIYVAAAIVAVLVIGLAAVKLLGGHSGQQRPAASSGTSAASLRRKVTSPTASPSVTATTPASFAGHWSGQVRQPPADTYNVLLTLASGSSTGSVSYSTAGISSCSPSLSLVSATSRQLTFSQSAQGGCSAGTVTLTLTSGGSISYHFSGGGLTATGTLSNS